MSNFVVPNDFIDLLSRVNAELTRRNGNGDLSGHAGIAFDIEPKTGMSIDYEHAQKILNGLSLISSNGLPEKINRFISQEDMDSIKIRLAANESQPRGATSGNDCAAACSGMCVSSCTTGCGGTCSGGCSGTCSSTCRGGCSGSCDNSCSGGCDGSCGGSNCSWTCRGDCSGGCRATCANGGGASVSVSV